MGNIVGSGSARNQTLVESTNVNVPFHPSAGSNWPTSSDPHAASVFGRGPASLPSTPEYAAAAAYQRQLKSYRHGMHIHYAQLCQELKETREMAQLYLNRSWWYYPLPSITPSPSGPHGTTSPVSYPQQEKQEPQRKALLLRLRLKNRFLWWAHKTRIAAAVEREMAMQKKPLWRKMVGGGYPASDKGENRRGLKKKKNTNPNSSSSSSSIHPMNTVDQTSRVTHGESRVTAEISGFRATRSQTQRSSSSLPTSSSASRAAVYTPSPTSLYAYTQPVPLATTSTTASGIIMPRTDVSTSYFSPAAVVVNAMARPSRAAPQTPPTRMMPRPISVSSLSAYGWWLGRYFCVPLGVGLLYLYDVVTPNVRAQALHETLHDRALDELELTIQLYP